MTDNYDLTKSEYQTGEWRKSCSWYKGGRHAECEKYQLKKIEEITGRVPKKPKKELRLNMKTYEITENPINHNNIDFFDYSETIDAVIEFNGFVFYYNLKFICDNGGAQTRSLREVYHFVKAQLKYLKKCKNTYFRWKHII